MAISETHVLRARHAACFLRLVEQAELTDPHPSRVLMIDFVDDVIHNLRAAFDWAVEYDSQVALGLGAALLSWSGSRGPNSEAQRVIDRIFAMSDFGEHTVLMVRVLLRAAAKTEEEGLAYAEEALTISRELGYSRGEAEALLWLGRVTHTCLRDGEAANRFLTTSLAHYQTLQDAGGIAHALVVLSEVALMGADFSKARILAEESVAVAQKAGFSFPWPLAVLANLAWGEGNLAGARRLYEQSLAIARPLRQNGTLIYLLTEAGYLATLQEDFKAAQSFLDEAFVFLEKMADPVFTCACKWYLAVLAQAQGSYGDAVRLYQTCLPGMTRYQSNRGPHLLHLAAMAEAFEQHELAATLLGAVGPIDESICRLFPIERAAYNRLADAARSHLGATSFDVALAQGRQQEFAQTVGEGLAILETALAVQGWAALAP